jgi:hypothetical protein
MTANALRLTRNVGFPKLTDSSAPASDAAAARKRVTATFAVEFNVRGAFANLAPGKAYANARNAMPLDHLLLRSLNQTARKRASLSGRFGSTAGIALSGFGLISFGVLLGVIRQSGGDKFR